MKTLNLNNATSGKLQTSIYKLFFCLALILATTAFKIVHIGDDEYEVDSGCHWHRMHHKPARL